VNLLNLFRPTRDNSLLEKADRTKCWWCGSSELTGEHKWKKTDIELIYPEGRYDKGNRPGLVTEDNNGNDIKRIKL